MCAMLTVWAALLYLLLATAAVAADFYGPVIAVLNGDTLEVLHNSRPERIRLSGIDCAEKGQAFGNRAKQAASALVFGKVVILQAHGQAGPCAAQLSPGRYPRPLHAADNGTTQDDKHRDAHDCYHQPDCGKHAKSGHDAVSFPLSP